MRKSTDRFITIQNSSPTSLTEKSFHQQVAIRRMPEFDRAKAQRKLVRMRGSRSTMVIQRDFSLNPARYSVSSAVDSSSVAVETDTIDFLLKRMGTQKYRRRGKDANLCELLDDVLVSSSWRGCWTDRKKRKMRERERERESQSVGEDRCWPLQACFNSLIRRERQGAENNRAFSRGTFQSSSSARRVVPFSSGSRFLGGMVVRRKDPEEVASLPLIPPLFLLPSTSSTW